MFLVLHDPPGGGSFAAVQERLSYEVTVAASSAQTADHSDWHWMKTIKTPKKADMEAGVDPVTAPLGGGTNNDLPTAAKADIETVRRLFCVQFCRY